MRRGPRALVAELLSDEPHRGPRAPLWVQAGLIVLVGVIFGFQLVPFKEALKDASPSSVVALRSLGMLPFLVLVVHWAGIPASTWRSGWRPVLLPSLLLVGSQICFIYGVERLTAGLTATLLSTTPIISVVVGLVLRVERVATIALAGSAVGTVGVAIATGAIGGGVDAVGVLLMLGCNLTYALSLVLMKRSKQKPSPAAYLVAAAAMGCLVFLPLAGAVDGFSLTLTWSLLGSVAYMVVLGQAVAYVAIFGVLRYGGPFQATLVTPLIPVFGIMFAVLLLGEPLLGRELAGGALIVLGVIAAILPARRAAAA